MRARQGRQMLDLRPFSLGRYHASHDSRFGGAPQLASSQLFPQDEWPVKRVGRLKMSTFITLDSRWDFRLPD